MSPEPDGPTFTAIDFETATHEAHSACAIGLVRVENGVIVDRLYRLIRPPSRYFRFTYIHNIDWSMVEGEPTFGELFAALTPFFRGVDFIAAHNASFDHNVLKACCARYDVPMPDLEWKCTVRIARTHFRLRRASLRHVADHLGLDLNHHHAASDAEACAQIVLRAW